MSDNITVTYRGKTYDYPKGTPLKKVAEDFQDNYDTPIVLTKVGHKLRELHHTLTRDAEIDFETVLGNIGSKVYKRSLCLLLIKALFDTVGRINVSKCKIEFSIGPGYYCTVLGDFELTPELVEKIKSRMRSIVEEDIPIEKQSFPLEEVREYCRKNGMEDKDRLFRYRISSNVNMYSIGDMRDYFYGFMVPSTGYLKYFDLYLYREGLILQLPEKSDYTKVPEFDERPRLFETMFEASKWNEVLEVETVGDLNDRIASGQINELILAQEALQEGRISEIAQEIVKKKEKFIMIAGPSSSGKTSFSYRLSVQLRAKGMKPHAIALDNYFKNRKDTPRDSDGKIDYECLEAIDVEGFNEDMTRLLKGERVELPTYNFITGEREYKGNFLKLKPDDVLVIEGIHGINDELSYSLPADSKFKIYISALTTLNIDMHNRIPTTDGRLLRRLVRDHRTRGASASHTLDMWSSVRRGEERFIFPFQEKADIMFNSALIYELSVLKQFAEPLLFSITPDDPGYQVAVRLLKMLQYFLGINTEDLPKNSLIREFVGGSCFPV